MGATQYGLKGFIFIFSLRYPNGAPTRPGITQIENHHVMNGEKLQLN